VGLTFFDLFFSLTHTHCLLNGKASSRRSNLCETKVFYLVKKSEDIRSLSWCTCAIRDIFFQKKIEEIRAAVKVNGSTFGSEISHFAFFVFSPRGKRTKKSSFCI
jgi:hypothetical protein